MTFRALRERLSGAQARPRCGQVRLHPRFARRAWVLAAIALTFTSLAGAASVQVPFRVQADLIAKVASFDRNFSARAGARALVIIVQMPNDAESAAAALELKNALSNVATVGDRPHEEQIVSYSSAAALAELARTRKPAIIYFGPGFAKELTGIRNSLSNLSLLSVGMSPDYVEGGMVLGFDLVSGRPKLLINLSQARKQQVDFPASVLRLMKIYS